MKPLDDYLNMHPLELVNRIERAKRDKHAIILSHNYQVMEVQAVGDIIGDSLELARAAAQTDAELIVFCGVDFMAESAKVLNPTKKVIIPELHARCPMAAMVNPNSLKALKEKYPDALVVSYVNTSAAVKAESYVCCTSSNAIKVVKSLGDKQIIFVPDKNLALYVQKMTGADIIPWAGYCYVHNNFTQEHLDKATADHPKAKFIAHPECPMFIIDQADEVASTSGMIKYVEKMSTNDKVILGTEEGLIKRINSMYPDKKVYPLYNLGICKQMKSITLAKTCWAIENEENVIDVPQEHIEKARIALDRMLAITA